MTASYDKSNLMDVLNDILHDDGMLASRANPGNNTPRRRLPCLLFISSDEQDILVPLHYSRSSHHSGLFQNERLPESTLLTQKLQLRVGLKINVFHYFVGCHS